MDPYIGEIRQVGFTFAPQGWLTCNGQLVSISENEGLFAIIGTTYGGDGQNTFGLPDLRGRAPLCPGNKNGVVTYLGQAGGTEAVTLTALQVPSHPHPVSANSGAASAGSPQNAVFASGVEQYGVTSANITAPMLTTSGGGQPHANLMPFVCLNFIIATQGIYPSQS